MGPIFATFSTTEGKGLKACTRKGMVLSTKSVLERVWFLDACVLERVWFWSVFPQDRYLLRAIV